jgi:pimeloyl-ACP methyl ester carboxylesterase
LRYAIAAAIAMASVAGVFARPSTGSGPPEPVEGQPDTPPLSHEYADVNGVKLHYARAGNGPLIVFLHGFPEFWYEWKNQIAEFSKDHTVVAPDMRGYNLSSKPSELSAYQMPNLVEDLRALASHLLGCRGTGLGGVSGTGLGSDAGDRSRTQPEPRRPVSGTGLGSDAGDRSRTQLEPRRPVSGTGLGNDASRDLSPCRFTLVAHDWGGVVAWVFAAQHPEMLDKLVIINAPHPTVFGKMLRDDPAQQRASSYMLMFRGDKAEETLSANAYGTLTSMVLGAGLKDGTVTDADRKMYVDAWSQPGALTGGLNYYRAAGIGPPTAATSTAAAGASITSTPPAAAPAPAVPPIVVRVPTLVIWGEKDTALLTGNLDGLDEFVPKLTIKRIVEGTHWVVRERPGDVNRYIRDFLAQP